MNREAVFEQLKIDEGVVSEIYLDHLGYPTFGVGHLVLERDPEHGQPVGTPVSDERVRECFDADLDLAISECVALYGVDVWEGFPDEAAGQARLHQQEERTGAEGGQGQLTEEGPSPCTQGRPFPFLSLAVCPALSRAHTRASYSLHCTGTRAWTSCTTCQSEENGI